MSHTCYRTHRHGVLLCRAFKQGEGLEAKLCPEPLGATAMLWAHAGKHGPHTLAAKP
jgi:hypothetical protein